MEVVHCHLQYRIWLFMIAKKSLQMDLYSAEEGI